MEKYFLSKLDDFRLDPSCSSRPKFVDIQYSRKLPFFGLVYCSDDSANTSVRLASKTRPSASEIRLASLDSSDNKSSASIKIIKRIQIRFEPSQKSPQHGATLSEIVDFDSADSVQINEDQQASSSKRGPKSNSPDCVALDELGRLAGLWFCDESSQLIANLSAPSQNLATANRAKHIQVRLHKRHADNASEIFAQTSEDVCCIHALTQRSYTLYKLGGSKQLEPLGTFSMNLKDSSESASLEFTAMFTVNPNPALVVLESSDFSLRFVSNFVCLTVISLGPEPRRHTIMWGKSTNEFMLLSATSSEVEARALRALNKPARGQFHRVSDELEPHIELNQSQDPDGLLVKEPSFELESCWSIDLQTIDSIRTLLDDSTHSSGQQDSRPELCLCPMWTPNEPLKLTQSEWPKFLIVAFKFHVLVYSFEQQRSTPFSVVYDQSFLKLLEPEQSKGSAKVEQPDDECVDVRLRPKLLHNFNLIGVQARDSLFNTLFLVQASNFSQLSHFSQLSLLAGLTNLGHLMAFKFSSNKIVVHKDNVLQQLVGDMIRNEALLRAQVGSVEEEVAQLESELAKLERQLSSSTPGDSEQQLDQLLQVDLVLRHEVGCLYDLSLSWSSLVDASHVLIVSNVDSFILEPKSVAIKSVEINNDSSTSDESQQIPLIISNLQLPSRTSVDSAFMAGASDLGSDRVSSISAWCLIELDQASMKSANICNTRLKVGMFIMDGQSGSLDVYLELADAASESICGLRRIRPSCQMNEPQVSDNSADWESSLADFKASFYMTSIDVKPLMSYEASNPFSSDTENITTKVEISGNFEPQTMSRWLNELVRLPSFRTQSCRLVSPFTRSWLEFRLEPKRLRLSSDNILAIETIKQHVLKRATDVSIRLETEHLQQQDLGQNLSHLIELQLENLTKLMNSSQDWGRIAISDQGLGSSLKTEADFLIETLMTETDTSELVKELKQSDVEQLESIIRADIENLVGQEVKSTGSSGFFGSGDNDFSTIHRDMIIGFIIDTLVDFDKLQGKRISSDAIVAMRTKLIESVLPKINKLSSASFVSKILDNWKNVCFF